MVSIYGKKSTIAVDITNDGIFPFKPEKYGSTITITRTMPDSGFESYSLKNGNGEIISTSYRILL